MWLAPFYREASRVRHFIQYFYVGLLKSTDKRSIDQTASIIESENLRVKVPLDCHFRVLLYCPGALILGLMY